jgi:hypothetical protein
VIVLPFEYTIHNTFNIHHAMAYPLSADAADVGCSCRLLAFGPPHSGQLSFVLGVLQINAHKGCIYNIYIWHCTACDVQCHRRAAGGSVGAGVGLG